MGQVVAQGVVLKVAQEVRAVQGVDQADLADLEALVGPGEQKNS